MRAKVIISPDTSNISRYFLQTLQIKGFAEKYKICQNLLFQDVKIIVIWKILVIFVAEVNPKSWTQLKGSLQWLTSDIGSRDSIDEDGKLNKKQGIAVVFWFRLTTYLSKP